MVGQIFLDTASDCAPLKATDKYGEPTSAAKGSTPSIQFVGLLIL